MNNFDIVTESTLGIDYLEMNKNFELKTNSYFLQLFGLLFDSVHNFNLFS